MGWMSRFITRFLPNAETKAILGSNTTTIGTICQLSLVPTPRADLGIEAQTHFELRLQT
jgi:hypothetical protein